MKVSGLLKLKNKLSGEMTRLQTLMAQENVVVNDNRAAFDDLKLYEDYRRTSEELAAVKTRLANANVAIYDKIFEMAELKGRASFLKSLEVKQGTFTEGWGDVKTVTTYTPAMGKVFVEEELKKITSRLDELQETLDEFNHGAVV